MTRKKVKIVFISNDTARRACFKKRRVGLLKKVSELTVLCGVDAFCIIYGPNEEEPVVWPNHSTVEWLLTRYQDLPEIERCKKLMNQESYLRERIGKAKDHSKKQRRKNKEMDLTFLMQQLHQGKDIDDFDLSEMQCFDWLVQERMKDIRKRVDYFQQVPSLAPGPFTSFSVPGVEGIGFSAGRVIADGGTDGMVNPSDPMLWDQWLVDTLMTNGNGAGSSSTRSDMGLPYRVHNMSRVGSGSGMNMGIGSLHGNAGGTNNSNVFSLGLPDHGNFLGRGNNRNGIEWELPCNIEDNNYDGDAIGLGLPHEASEGINRNGVLLGIMGMVNGNLGGNNAGNVNVVDPGLPYANWEGGINGRNFPDVEMPYNESGGSINGRNWDYMRLPNGNPDGFGNQMGLGLPPIGNIAANSGIIDWNNAIGNGMGLANDLNGGSGGSIAGSDFGFQAGFFGGASDIGL